MQVAFGHGKPVITTAVGGLAEVVTHEETGLVVPPEDAAALAAAIEQFFAQDLGPLFMQKIVEGNGRFSWQQLVLTLERLAAD